MHIWILWWTGRTWRECIKEAHKAWWTISTLVRHPEKFTDTTIRDAITIYQWDATNPEDIQQLEACDVLIDTVSVGLWHKKPTQLYARVAKALIEVWDELSAQQLYVMSSTGTHHWRDLPVPFSWGYEWLLGDVADDKERAEALYADSNLPWSIIKATKLQPLPPRTPTLQAFATYTPSLFHYTTRKTVAKVIIDAIDNDFAFTHQKIVVR